MQRREARALDVVAWLTRTKNPMRECVDGSDLKLDTWSRSREMEADLRWTNDERGQADQGQQRGVQYRDSGSEPKEKWVRLIFAYLDYFLNVF